MGSEFGGGDRPLRVLVADDEPDVLLLLRVQLGGRSDIELVGTASDGAEAVEQCRSLQPDAVVMDLLMPNVSGFDAIDVLEAELPDIAVVAHSAVGSERVREELLKRGIPLVVKSGDAETLVTALFNAVEQASG
jgi:two-component system nitrate/nitrite response regulator NarL